MDLKIKGNEEKYIKLTALVLALGIALWYMRKVISKLFGFADEEKEEKEEEDKKQLYSENLQTEAAKHAPTKSKAEWTSIADLIYSFLRYSVGNDTDGAFYQLCRVKNDTDYWLLYEAFGTRQAYSFMVPVGAKQTLTEFVHSELSSDQILKINDNYRRKNMSFRF